MSIRAAARIADVPHPTVQGWLSGKHFPTPALRPNFLLLLDELGLADAIPEDLWDEGWEHLRPTLRDGRAPYPGLRPFGVCDGAFFFGRAHEVRRLAEAVAEVRRTTGHGIVALVGPSGSGKSSLLAAGLIAGECTDGVLAGWRAELVLVSGLNEDRLAGADLIVVDQFEDAILRDPEERPALLARLGELAEEAVVLIALRSDAFAPAMQEPLLVDPLSHPVLLAPLTRADLRDIIVGPAETVGVAVDDDLVQVLLDELAPARPRRRSPWTCCPCCRTRCW